jgi:hypothetical protein
MEARIEREAPGPTEIGYYLIGIRRQGPQFHFLPIQL